MIILLITAIIIVLVAVIRELQETLASIVSAEVEAFMMLHEQEQHQGKLCMDERINTLAWIAHRAGIKSTQVGEIVERLKEWEEYHKQHEH